MSVVIIVNQSELGQAVSKMQALRNQSLHAIANSDIFTLSISDTADALAETCRILLDTEKALLLLVDKTIAAMEAAGVSFDKADLLGASEFDNISGSFTV